MPTRTRHDTLFHEMVRFALFRQGFVITHMEKADVEELALDGLGLMPESFTRAHKTVVPDCVLRAPLKRARGWGYIVVKQETSPNKKELLTRLKVAKARIFEYDLNDPSSEVPPLIRAIIFCTGRKRWTRELDLYAALPEGLREQARRSLGEPPRVVHVSDLKEDKVLCSEVPPLIRATIFCTGQKRWTRELDLYAALPEGLRERVRRSLGEPPRVVHVSDLKEDKVLSKACPELALTHLLFQKAYEDPVAVIGELEPLLARVLRRKGGRAVLQTAIDYLCPHGGQEQTREFILKIDQALTRADVKEAIMSFSEVFRHEGKQLGLKEGLQKGLERGLQKGKLETARNLLVAGVDLQVISKATGLPRQKLTALRKK